LMKHEYNTTTINMQQKKQLSKYLKKGFSLLTRTLSSSSERPVPTRQKERNLAKRKQHT
jgi:hypothetical protein